MNLTGIWYNPAFNGSGFSIHDFEGGIVLYWYNYAKGFPSLPKDDNTQLWMIGQPEDTTSPHDFLLYRPSAEWMGKDYELGDPVGALTLTEVGEELEVEYRFYSLGFCQPVTVSPVWDGCSGKFKIQRLTPKV